MRKGDIVKIGDRYGRVERSINNMFSEVFLYDIHAVAVIEKYKIQKVNVVTINVPHWVLHKDAVANINYGTERPIYLPYSKYVKDKTRTFKGLIKLQNRKSYILLFPLLMCSTLTKVTTKKGILNVMYRKITGNLVNQYIESYTLDTANKDNENYQHYAEINHV